MSNYLSDFHYHDVAEWRQRGLPLSTVSDEAARSLDALITTVVFMDSIPERGAAPDLMKKALAADPDFVMLHTVKWMFQAMGNLSRVAFESELRCKLRTVMELVEKYISQYNFVF